MTALYRKSLRYGAYALAAGVVLIALSLALLWLWFPQLGDQKVRIERYLSEQVGRPILVEMLETAWDGLTPTLRARGVRIRYRDDSQSTARLGELRLALDLPALLSGSVRFRQLTLAGATLEFVRTPDGRIRAGDWITRGESNTSGIIAINWLLSQERVKLEDSVLVWRDERSPERSLVLSSVNLEIRRLDGVHRFAGSAAPPLTVGRDIKVDGEISGALSVTDPWEGTINLKVVGLNLGGLPKAAYEWLSWSGEGQLDAQISTSWVAGRPTSAIADVDLTNFQIPYTDSRPPIQADRFTTQVSAHLDGENWRVTLIQPELTLADRVLRASQLGIDRLGDTNVISVDQVNVKDVLGMLGQLEVTLPWADLLAKVRPEGVVNSAFLTLQGALRKPDDWRFEGRFVNAGWAPFERFPGVRGADGDIHLDRLTGALEIAGTDVELNFPQALRGAVTFAEFAGDMSWRRSGEEWHVEVARLRLHNDDLAIANGQVVTRIPLDLTQSPYVDARVEVPRARLDKLRDYFPAKVMPEKALKWLDRALQSGVASDGRLTLTGRLRDFPFRDGRGRFEFATRVSAGKLEFHHEWPVIDGIEALVRFHDAGVTVTASDGVLYRSRVRVATVSSTDLYTHERALKITGEASGPVDDAVQFLLSGPLIKDKNKLELTGAGTGRLQVEVDLKIADARAAKVQGSYTTGDGGLRFANGIELNGLQGTVRFTESTVSADGVNGRLLDGPVTLEVTTVTPAQPPIFTITGRGHGEVNGLEPVLGKRLLSFLSGTAEWSGRLTVAKHNVRLDVASPLRGVAVTMPAPLAKAVDAEWPIQASVEFRDGGRHRDYFSLNDVLTGALEFGKVGEDTRLERGELVLGSGRARLPDTAGLRFAAVRDRLDADPWLAVLRTVRAAGPGDSAYPIADELRSARAEIGALRMFGRELGGLSLVAHSADSRAWRAELSGTAAQGTARAYIDSSRSSYSLQLERLHWPRADDVSSGGADDVLPTDYPELEVVAREFRFGDMQLGSLHLQAEPRAAGWYLDRIEMEQPSLRIAVSGRWARVGDNQESRFRLSARSDDLGTALARLGYPGYVGGGTAQLSALLSWPDGPGGFQFGVLDGEFTLSARKGRFLKVEPGGSGRLLGLLNVEAVMRRLTLDFSDIFEKGLAFDTITGKATIYAGDLVTDGFYVIGPAAVIEAQGRTGLVAEDYDMQVTVAPQLGGNLSLLSALANPAAGALVFVLQRVLKKQLAKVVHYTYHVSGPWASPNITRAQEGPQGQGSVLPGFLPDPG